MIRLQIASRSNVLLGELTAAIGPVSWRLSGVGRCQFWIPIDDDKATETYLQYGNRVYIDFDNGLPAWGGVIDTPRDWDNGTIKINAYSAEHILGWRQTDKGRYFTSATVGTIFTALIDEMNAVENTYIETDSVYSGGTTHSPDYHYANVLKTIQESLCSRLSTAEFNIIPSVGGGSLSFAANLYEKRGSDKSGSVSLMEGHNISSVRFLEQGTIVNWWDCAGEGTDWGDGRITANAVDTSSQSTYGLRQDSKVYGDVSEELTLIANTDNLLEKSKDPQNILELVVVDLAPAEFSAYDVGDIIRVELYNYGFGGLDTDVRVTAREYNPADGTCKLVVLEEQ